MELRIYAGTTGDAIAGDRHGDYQAEQERVEADFLSGVRLIIDETRGEIRGFVPADRGSQEAFIAAMSVPDTEPLSPTTFVESIRKQFDQIDGWHIRTDTPEGQLLEALESEPPSGTEPALPVGLVRDGKRIRAGAPDLATAGRELRALRSAVSETASPRIYSISLSVPVEHVDPNLLVHVGGEYESVQVLDDNRESG